MSQENVRWLLSICSHWNQLHVLVFVLPYDITVMISLLFFFHVCKVATLIQIKEIYSQPYLYIYISVSQPVGNTGIAVFAGRAIFAVITSNWRTK